MLVEFEGDDLEAARAAAMQVAAMRPQYVTRDEVPADVVENERRIAEATAREEGKPEQALPKIVEGRVNGFFKDVALLEQPSVLDSKKTVKAVLDAAGVTVKRFARFEVGGSLSASAGRLPAETTRTATRRGGRDRAGTPGGDRHGPRPRRASRATPRRYRRVVLKLSGEVFGGGKLGVDPDVVATIARQIADVVRTGVQVAIVVGGGNFFRGAELSQRGMDRARADYMGMLGTVMNCLALQDFLEKQGVETRVQTAIAMGQVAEPYIPRRAIRHLEKGRVVIFGAGAGMPYFSTDTVAAQRALEIGAQVRAHGQEGRRRRLRRRPAQAPGRRQATTGSSYDEVLARGLKVADATAFSLCRDNQLPIVVFNLIEPTATSPAPSAARRSARSSAPDALTPDPAARHTDDTDRRRPT